MEEVNPTFITLWLQQEPKPRIQLAWELFVQEFGTAKPDVIDLSPDFGL